MNNPLNSPRKCLSFSTYRNAYFSTNASTSSSEFDSFIECPRQMDVCWNCSRRSCGSRSPGSSELSELDLILQYHLRSRLHPVVLHFPFHIPARYEKWRMNISGLRLPIVIRRRRDARETRYVSLSRLTRAQGNEIRLEATFSAPKTAKCEMKCRFAPLSGYSRRSILHRRHSCRSFNDSNLRQNSVGPAPSARIATRPAPRSPRTPRRVSCGRSWVDSSQWASFW